MPELSCQPTPGAGDTPHGFDIGWQEWQAKAIPEGESGGDTMPTNPEGW